MADASPGPIDPADDPDELDTKGQAFTWSVDPTDGRKLRQDWTPDDPKDVPASRDLASNQRKADGRRP